MQYPNHSLVISERYINCIMYGDGNGLSVAEQLQALALRNACVNDEIGYTFNLLEGEEIRNCAIANKVAPCYTILGYSSVTVLTN